MSFYADLHIHSKYSRATSKNCDLENLAYWARKKGITVVGTGDFTHPAWRAELAEKLVPAEPGLFRLRADIERAVDSRVSIPGQCATRFLLSVEISTIYKKGDRTRKVHHLIYAPDLASVGRMVERLTKIGNLHSDGRPILGLDSRDLLEIVLEASEHCYLVPAHAWTPWFAVLGSQSGFDDVAECYGDLADHVFAIETGLSSDPPMNWRLSMLDRYTLMSNSDAHSPAKLGREACVFDCDMDYFAMRRALETRHGYGGTVEFFPEEGKYHLDGHRKCGVVLEPEQTRAVDGRCPVCKRPLTIGVMHRILALADRPAGFRPEHASPFRSLVPLPEMLAEIMRSGADSKVVSRNYESLLARIGPEFVILDHVPIEDLQRAGSPQLAEAISRMRAGRVICQPGFDGEYGVIRLFEDHELQKQPRASLSLKFPESGTSGGSGNPGREAGTTRVSGQVEESSRQGGTASASRPGREQSPRPRSGGQKGDQSGKEVLGARSDARSNDRAREQGPQSLLESEEPLDARPDAGSELLTALDPEQRQAAQCIAGPLLIIAGPGTGKTRTLTHRLAHLVSSCSIAPEACLAITFTNRAAEELRERLSTLLPDMGERIWVKTFHGLGLAILQENRERAGLHRGFRVASETECITLITSALDCSQRKARAVLARISQIKRAQWARALEETLPEEALPEDALLNTYQLALETAGLVDFDDLLVRSVGMLESEPDIRAAYQQRFLHVSIDEYQDIDELQYRLVSLLSGALLCQPLASTPASTVDAPIELTSRSLCVIGDPDQAIYGFRGADVRFFLRFREDFPATREVRLTRNYRSTRTIVDASLQAIAPSSLISGRVLSALVDDESQIAVVSTASERAEAELVVRTIEAMMGGTSFFSLDSGRVGHGHAGDLDFSDFAVLYRVDAQAGPLCEAFARSGMPFQKRSHGKIGDRPVVKDLIERAQIMVQSERMHVSEALRAAAAGLIPSGAERVPGHPDESSADESPDEDIADENTERQQTSKVQSPAYRSEDIKDALNMLVPLAERCGSNMEQFLTELAMDTEVDAWDPRADRVSLLTLHASKGLEFRVVFLVGCEDGLLPLHWGPASARPSAANEEAEVTELVRAASAGSFAGSFAGSLLGNPGDDEERRLFFVGMTRARDQLYLTRARKRMWRGKVRELEPSPFMRDIEERLLARKDSKAKAKKSTSASEQLGLF